MITRTNLYELFETQWLMMRQNPGGGSPYLQGFLLGFAGTIDVADALTGGKGIIKIKVGNGDVQKRTVDFSAAFPSELAPGAAAEALNDAEFEDCKFSVDPETGRLMLKPDEPVRFIQIYGNLAGALQFGDCRFQEGKGCYIWPSFENDLKSTAETEQWDEDTVIENDSPLGKPVKYTIPGKRSGTQLVITDRLDSRAAKQMINGGRWIDGTANTPDIYEPPASGSRPPARVDVFTYSKILEKYSNVEGDEAFVRERLYVGCIGRKVRTGGSGSMTDAEYTFTAPDYTGEDGQYYASPKESDYAISQWDALQMSGVIVNDWEGA